MASSLRCATRRFAAEFAGRVLIAVSCAMCGLSAQAGGTRKAPSGERAARWQAAVWDEWIVSAKRDVKATARDLAVDVDRNVWMATDGGLIRWTGFGKHTRIGCKQGLHQTNLSAVLVMRDQRVAVAGPYGVEIYDPKTGTVQHPMRIDTKFRWGCSRMTQAPDGSLWVATQEGPMRLRIGARPELYGVAERIALLAEEIDIDTVALPRHALEQITIRGGTGVVIMPIASQNYVAHVCAGSPAAEGGVRAGDRLRITPAPDTPGGKIKFRFEIERKGGVAVTSDAFPRKFEAKVARLQCRDVLVDRFRTLWVSTGRRLLRLPLLVDGRVDLTKIKRAQTLGSARQIRLRNSPLLGAIWAFDIARSSAHPQLFGARGLEARSEIDFGRGRARVLDLWETTAGSVFASTVEHGILHSEQAGDWRALRTVHGTLPARHIALSPDDHITLVLGKGRIARADPPRKPRPLSLQRRLLSIARDASRWYHQRDDGCIVSIDKLGHEQRYPTPSLRNSQDLRVAAHSSRIAWALDSAAGELLYLEAGRVTKRAIPASVKLGAALRVHLSVDQGGDAYVGPYGVDDLYLLHFAADGQAGRVYRMPPGALKKRSKTLPIFRFDGRRYLAHDTKIYPLHDASDVAVEALEATDEKRWSLPDCHGSICSVVTRGDTVWFATDHAELIRWHDGRAARSQLPEHKEARLVLGTDDSLWAITASAALRFDDGTWTRAIDLRALRTATAQLEVLPAVHDDVFISTWKDGDARTYRWQESTARPVASLEDPASRFEQNASVCFDCSSQRRWHDEEQSFDYQYRVDGGSWSTWSSEPHILLSEIDVGEHRLELRSRARGSRILSQTVGHSFRVQRVWPVPAFILAALAALGLLSFGFARARRKRGGLRADPEPRTFHREPAPRRHAAPALSPSGAATWSESNLDLDHDIRNLRMLLEMKVAEIEAANGKSADSERARAALRQLIGEIHDLAPETCSTDLERVIASLLTPLTALVPTSVVLETRYRATDSEAAIARGPFVQVLLNLVFNSCDAIADTGGITIATRDLDDGERKRFAKDGIAIEVVDTGSGMDAITLKNCFEEHYTTKIKIGHRGHGLATVQRIVKRAGGEIVATSALGSGCRFTVLLPRQSATPPRGFERADATPLDVLICDDHAGLRNFLVGALERRAMRATPVCDITELTRELERGASHGIDALVLDLQLGDRSGFQVAQLLRSRGIETPILFVSGSMPEDLGVQLQRLPSASFLPKPFSVDALVTRLREICGD